MAKLIRRQGDGWVSYYYGSLRLWSTKGKDFEFPVGLNRLRAERDALEQLKPIYNISIISGDLFKQDDVAIHVDALLLQLEEAITALSNAASAPKWSNS